MRLGYPCFGCGKECEPFKNKHWCQDCLSHGYYQGAPQNTGYRGLRPISRGK